jgi:hypothetical protein
VAICIKIFLYLHFFQLEGDKLFQAVGAKNLVEGRGITFQHVLASDLSTQVTEPVNRWPIAYTLILAPIYWLTNNMEAACIIIDIFSICFFFIALFRLLHHLQLHAFLINTLVLFAGCTFGPTLSKPTDMLACAGLLYACLLLLRFASNTSKSSVYGLAVASAIVIPAAFRYMYVPCALVMPLILLWIGYRRNDQRIKRGALYAMLATVLLSAALFMLQKAVVGNSTYVVATRKGLFPENLLMMYPFIPDTFVDINFVLQQIILVTPISFNSLYHGLQLVNAILLIILLYKWITVARKRPLSRQCYDLFLILTGACSGSLLLLLAYLSLTNSAKDFRSSISWTFIGDGRYFLFPVTILPVVAGYWIFNRQWSSYRKCQPFLKYLFFVLILFQLTHTLYFMVRRSDPVGLSGGNVLITRPAQSYLQDKIREYGQQGYNVVLTGTEETVCNWATMNGANGVLRVEELLEADVRPNKPSIVFVLVGRRRMPFVEEKLFKKNFRFEKEFNGMGIFSSKFESH